MAQTTNEKLAAALEMASSLAVNNIVQSKLIKPRERALLVKERFLKPIIRGWYILDADVSTVKAGDSALWFDSIWGFVGQYLEQSFGDDYFLSPESSLDLLTSSNALPKQIIVYADTEPRTLALPHHMGLLVFRSKKKPYRIESKLGVNVMSLESVLADVAPSAYTGNSLSLQLALAKADLSELAGAFAHVKNAAAMGRVLGAFKALNKNDQYLMISRMVDGMGFTQLDTKNPFDAPVLVFDEGRNQCAASMRIRALWGSLREDVIDSFSGLEPSFDFMQRPINNTLSDIEDLYIQDAYHSLSIEGYKVTPHLIKKVRSGDWHPESISQDKEAKDALAARGYYEAFESVKVSLHDNHSKKVTSLTSAVAIGLTNWYTSLFQPCVTAGIIDNKDIAGFRKGPVYIRLSRHAPPADIYLADCMEALGELIHFEPHYGVKAVLGHFCLGYIHPFPDGNGRSARFLMNFLLTLGGYNWTIINIDDRNAYLDALEKASVDHNGKPFAEFIAMSMRKTRSNS